MNSTQFQRNRSEMSRRRFLGVMGAAGGGAVAVSMLGSRFAFATPNEPTSGDAIVHIFLRGGWDALGAIGPFDTSEYQQLRPGWPTGTLRLRREGNVVGPDLGGRLLMHPDMAALYNGAWKAGKLAVVHACGMKAVASRSHFDAERHLANASVAPTSGAYLNRYVSLLDQAKLNALGFGAAMPIGLAGPNKAFSFVDEPSFRVSGFGNAPAIEPALVKLYQAGNRPLNALGSNTLAVLNDVRNLPADPGPGNGASYTNTGELGPQLEETARLLKTNIGIRTVAIEFGGWDTHNENVASKSRLAYLANALQAFYTDLGSAMNEVTVVVTSEFGRTIRQNSSGGTDHGVGGAMLVMGGNVKGGVYGGFPATGSLNEGANETANAQNVYNDFRQVMAEVLTKRGGISTSALSTVFPGWSVESPLGLAVA